MATISETTGDEREDRIAELKRKMQESAKKAKAKQEAEAESATAVAEAEPEAVETGSEATAEETVAAETAADSPVAEPTATTADEATADPSEAAATPAPVAESNGTAAAAPAATATVPSAPATEAATATATAEDEAERKAQAQMTRREFLTYAWGAAAGLLAAEAGLASYFFMYPRFRAGEFGGKFFLSESDVPAIDAPPAGEVAGKFWLVNTDEGTRALYMVCTHLGCLYKWESSNNRFECPCHGSKFSKAGYYIEGPAPRSLDTFEVIEENSQVIVDTGKKTVGGPATESPARAVTA